MNPSVEARHYTHLDNRTVRCGLCPHNCTIHDGKAGTCGVRKNDGGTLVSTIYGRVTSLAMDPVEKKPLYHFYPGSAILSIGTRGCNLKCPYCQNWHISQDLSAHAEYRSPDDIVRIAVEHGSGGIAYTYSEPIIWFEYVMDTARLAREKGLKNVMVTNGFVNPAPLEELLGYVDAMNIDLKAFRDETYRRVQKGGLEAVKATIAAAYAGGCHVEVTTLVVTGINDDMDEMREIAEFISGIDPAIPWHVSRYHPSYRYHEPSTDIRFLRESCEEGRKKLHFVYCGNVPSGEGGNDTRCPRCGELVIRRVGYHTMTENLVSGGCGKCGAPLGIRA
ncbi:MAG: AmmeMemoRadiSam system radical SAM enzyme [Spirochaetes bacterium]|nr:AmmeMemoRadiSam system radical SAM enzyme [Spirochaetota bacterium]